MIKDCKTKGFQKATFPTNTTHNFLMDCGIPVQYTCIQSCSPVNCRQIHFDNFSQSRAPQFLNLTILPIY